MSRSPAYVSPTTVNEILTDPGVPGSHTLRNTRSVRKIASLWREILGNIDTVEVRIPSWIVKTVVFAAFS